MYAIFSSAAEESSCMLHFSFSDAFSDSGNVPRPWVASFEYLEELNSPCIVRSALLHDRTRFPCAIGYDNEQHAYADGAANFKVANGVDQTMTEGWSSCLVLPYHSPTSQGLPQGDDHLSGNQSDWHEPGTSSPAAADDSLNQSQSSIVAREGAEPSAQIARRNQSCAFISQSLCCKYLPKRILLEGPLPSDDQTQEYLCQELGLPPSSTISLALNEQLRTSGRERTQIWCLNARVACILAIWGSEKKALTTRELLQALIDNIPYCKQNAHHAIIKSAEVKRKGWAATVLYQLSGSRMFVLKTPDGQPSNYWRIDVRGADYVTRRCSHALRSNY